MAKKRRESAGNEVKVFAFSEVDKSHIINNFKSQSVTQLSRDIGCAEEDVKQFIADLVKAPGAGRSRPTLPRRAG